MAELPDDFPPQEAFDRIAQISGEFRRGPCLLRVSRRGGFTLGPIAGCPHTRPGRPAAHSSLQFVLEDDTGLKVGGPGLPWHFLAEHPPEGVPAGDAGDLDNWEGWTSCLRDVETAAMVPEITSPPAEGPSLGLGSPFPQHR